MATLRYEQGHVVPLDITDELDDLQEGDVIEVAEWTASESPISKAELAAYERMLARTAGL